MNEPKRRGRPPKARLEGGEVPVMNGDKDYGCPECGQVVGHYDDCSIGLGAFAAAAAAVHRDLPAVIASVKPDSAKAAAMDAANAAQAYAERVWAGQSVSEPRTWRIERVRLALEGQGLSMEGVVLP